MQVTLCAESETMRKIRVEPSDNIIKELQHNNSDFVELLSEMIDNSIASRVGDVVNVRITVGYSDDFSKCFLEVEDDASGIELDKLPDALSPAKLAGLEKNTLHEHGIGMKLAIVSLGDLEYLITKSSSMDDAIRLEKIAFGDIPYSEVSFDSCLNSETGTRIRIQNLKPIVRMRQEDYTNHVIKQLGAKYRKLIHSKKLRVYVVLYNVDNSDKKKEWDIESVWPVYRNTKNGSNEVEYKKVFKGRGWEAELLLGFAPKKSQYLDMGLEPPARYHPYSLTTSTNGIDVLLYDRVVAFHQVWASRLQNRLSFTMCGEN